MVDERNSLGIQEELPCFIKIGAKTGNQGMTTNLNIVETLIKINEVVEITIRINPGDKMATRDKKGGRILTEMEADSSSLIK